MVVRLDAPQPTFPTISPKTLNTINDEPERGPPLGTVGALQLPPIIFGAGALSNQYNSDDHLASLAPLRAIRLALRSGITAFDTSAYYGPSEIILGNALKTLEMEHPRSSYKLMTKCGRFGPSKEDFDYSPATIRKSVERSLRRLRTTYLDVVYLHDVEFIAEPVLLQSSGDLTSALGKDSRSYGLAEDQIGVVWGDGDRKVLDALAELRKMQAEGLVKHIGITGYPLPTLLRLALLVLHSPPFKPLDILLSYSQSNMQNSAFAAFAPHFAQRAKIAQLVAASPLNMGLLTEKPPSWHPAPPGLVQAVRHASKLAEGWPGGLPNVALGYAMRTRWDDKIRDHSAEESGVVGDVPVVVGFSNTDEVYESLRVWREVHEASLNPSRLEMEARVFEEFNKSGFYGWAWESPVPLETH